MLGSGKLLCWPERDLDLDGHAGRSREAEHVGGAVMSRHRGDPGVLVGEVEGIAAAPEGVGLLAAGEEGLSSPSHPIGRKTLGHLARNPCGAVVSMVCSEQHEFCIVRCLTAVLGSGSERAAAGTALLRL